MTNHIRVALIRIGIAGAGPFLSPGSGAGEEAARQAARESVEEAREHAAVRVLFDMP